MSLRGISSEILPSKILPPSAPERVLTFRQGIFDVSEAVGVSMQALIELGLIIEDRNEAERTMTADFTKLADLGLAGRAYVLPAETVSFAHIIDVAEGKRPEGVSAKYVYPNLWTPRTEAHSYTDKDLNQGPKVHQAKLAVFTSLDTSVDPTLHHLNLPVDTYARNEWDHDAPSTQEQEAQNDQQAFEANNPGFTLTLTDHRAFAINVLMDRIRGIDPTSPDFYLNQGFMRLPQLGRRTIDGYSSVGDVRSYDGQSRFRKDSGGAYYQSGVGLSVGLREAA